MEESEKLASILNADQVWEMEQKLSLSVFPWDLGAPIKGIRRSLESNIGLYLESVNYDSVVCSIHGCATASIRFSECDSEFDEWALHGQEVYFVITSGDVIQRQVKLLGKVTKECVEAMRKDFAEYNKGEGGYDKGKLLANRKSVFSLYSDDEHEETIVCDTDTSVTGHISSAISVASDSDRTDAEQEIEDEEIRERKSVVDITAEESDASLFSNINVDTKIKKNKREDVYDVDEILVSQRKRDEEQAEIEIKTDDDNGVVEIETPSKKKKKRKSRSSDAIGDEVKLEQVIDDLRRKECDVDTLSDDLSDVKIVGVKEGKKQRKSKAVDDERVEFMPPPFSPPKKHSKKGRNSVSVSESTEHVLDDSLMVIPETQFTQDDSLNVSGTKKKKKKHKHVTSDES